MADISHQRGEDIALSATGDFALSDGPEMGRQRVLRRLLTSPGDYVWHPGYGAGLPRQVGAVANEARLAALIRRQMALEGTVSQAAPPAVAVRVQPTGTVTTTIRYVDSTSGDPIEASI